MFYDELVDSLYTYFHYALVSLLDRNRLHAFTSQQFAECSVLDPALVLLYSRIAAFLLVQSIVKAQIQWLALVIQSFLMIEYFIPQPFKSSSVLCRAPMKLTPVLRVAGLLD